MKLTRNCLALWVLCLLWVNCVGAPPADEGSVDYDGPSWEDLMADVIGPRYDDVFVVEAGKDPEDMELAAIAAAAAEMAPQIALGHGPLARDDVEGFAEYARACEEWLNDLAAAARNGDGAKTQRLILEGGRKHCEECHNALD